MDGNERQLIDGLFGKLQKVDAEAPPRDAEAEALILRRVEALPAAPYYMAQAILVQEQALAAAQQRVEQLERQLAEQPAGGFLAGLFGAGPPPTGSRSGSRIPMAGRPAMAHGAGGGFLAGAMQTALGVAGGVLVANAISSAFGGTPDASASPVDEERFAADPAAEESDIDAEFDAGDEW